MDPHRLKRRGPSRACHGIAGVHGVSSDSVSADFGTPGGRGYFRTGVDPATLPSREIFQFAVPIMNDDPIRLSRTTHGLVASRGEISGVLAEVTIDDVFGFESAHGELERRLNDRVAAGQELEGSLLPPIGQQEVWAAGVTYLRSRRARIEESQKDADIYDRVYEATRPELFFKASSHRVVGHRQPIVIRRDSNWNVPEAELTLAVNAHGAIFGFTAGNDVSSRQLEGENPLYLSQAKIWDGSCSLGPSIVVTDSAPPEETAIAVTIERGQKLLFHGETRLAEMKRSLDELVEYLFSECSFPHGVFLMTGTGIVPEAELSLIPGDVVSIEIEGIGTLVNPVVRSEA